MGLFDRSSSSTTNLTENNDRRLVLDNQSQGITGDSNTLTVHASDYGSIAKAMEVSSGAVTSANDSLMSALGIAGTATRDAISSNTSIANNAMLAITSTNRDSLNFASVVNRDSLDLAARGQALIATNAAESLGMVGHIADSAFALQDKTTQSAIKNGQIATDQVARAYDTATGYQADKQTADSKYLVIAGFIAVALVAIKAFS